MKKLNEFISPSEEMTISAIFSIDWTKSFEGIKLPHRKQDCSDFKNGLICGEFVVNGKMNCFNCEMKRTCNSCISLISQKKTYATENNMINRKPPNEFYQLLPWYVGKCCSKEQLNTARQNNIDFESASELLLKADNKMVEKRRFERIYITIESQSYIKHEDVHEIKEIFIYRFKHIKTDKFDNFILIG